MDRLERMAIETGKQRDIRNKSYREQALKLYPWVCGRCAREFDRSNLHELTVHHRDHNHDNNPPDGSNWELLCIYCHDNEHSRQVEAGRSNIQVKENKKGPVSRHKPFADLDKLLKR